MPSYIPLSKTAHRDAGVVVQGHAHALEQAVVPLVAQELPQVIASMVSAFVAVPEGSYELVAMQSLQRGVNLYVNTDGGWTGGYCPAWYRAHPFRLLQDSQSNRHVVCVDEDASAFVSQVSDARARLFDEQGEPTDLTRRTISFLEQLHQSGLQTQAIVRQLDEAGLIVPWPLQVTMQGSEQPERLAGIYRIDEQALKDLPGETLAALAGSGALSVAYSLMLSEHRMQDLKRRYQVRHQTEQHNQAASELDLEKLFGDEDDDLSFNF